VSIGILVCALCNWFIKSHLEAAYLLQSSKTAAFLPYIASRDGEKTLKDVIIPRLNEIQRLESLEHKVLEKGKVIDVAGRETGEN